MLSTGLSMDPKPATLSSLSFDSKQWKVNPRTGVISLKDEAFKSLCNKDPIEKWYTIDQEPIARGQFAAVYRCMHRITGGEFAAKFSSKRRLGADCTADLVHEVAVCALLRNATKVVGLVDVFYTTTELILVMEYAPGGDLQTLLDEDLVPYERNVICFLRQLLEGLVFIHDKNIVHLDIKPQNLVLMGDFPDCCVKLCDFEISRFLTPGYEVREILGTADYVAPEIIHYEPITTKTDMWSFGVLTYVLLTGFLPFGGDSDQETFLEITRGELDFPEELFEDISEHAIDFIKRLLIRQPHLRMSARDCLEHAWMQADIKLPNVPQTLYMNSMPTNTSSHTSPEINLNSKQPNPYLKKQLQSVNSIRDNPTLSLPPTIHTPPNLNEMDLTLSFQKAFEILESGARMSPRATTPINITPNILSPMTASPRDTGLPPLHPYMSTKVCPSTHSSTSSLNRGNSRQSLERLRSISKSREILVERLQNSSQRKALSRSRERLFDGRYGLHKPNGFEHRSFSHSVETLPPNDWYAFDESICNSYNSVNMLPLSALLPMVHENNINNRHYKSMASMERFNEKFPDNKNLSNRNCYFNSNMSANESDYDKIISRYKSTVNDVGSKRRRNSRHCVCEDEDSKLNNNYIRKSSTESNNYGRKTSSDSNNYARKSSNETNNYIRKTSNESNNYGRKTSYEGNNLIRKTSNEGNTLIRKTSNESNNLERKTSNESRKGSFQKAEELSKLSGSKQIPSNELNQKSKKNDKSKKDPQKRKKEKEKAKKLSLPNPCIQESSGKKLQQSSSSPSISKSLTSKSRGSVSHIEQRIQVRHERQIEKQENSKKNKRKGSSQNKTLNNSKPSDNRTKPTKDQKEKHNKTLSNSKSHKLSTDKEINVAANSSSVLESGNENKNLNNKKDDKRKENKSKNYKRDDKRKENKCRNNNKKDDKKRGTKIISNSETKIIIIVDKTKQSCQDKENNGRRSSVNTLKFGRQNSREAKENKTKEKLASLDDIVDDGIFSRSNSMDSSTSIDSASTIKAEETPTEILECILKNMKLSRGKTGSIESDMNAVNKIAKENENKINDLKSDINKKINKQISSNLTKLKESKPSRLDCPTKETPTTEIDSLTMIKEEEENSQTNRKKKTNIAKCRKNALANMIPINSSRANKFSPDMTNRSKSFSMQTRTSLYPIKLSRSNSIHLDTPLSGKPRPWGEVCNGAVNRACQMFSEKSVEIALVIRKSSDPTSDRL